MRNFMELELKRCNIRVYIISSLIITPIMLALNYMFAFGPEFDNNPAIQIFSSCNNLAMLFPMFNMVVFSVLSSVMHAKFITEEYRDKRVVLLFSYPVSRNKILYAKLAVVSLFTMVSMFLCSVINFGIFSVSESLFNFLADDFTSQIAVKSLWLAAVMSVASAAVGIVSTSIGFATKSIPATILPSLVIVSVLCNIVIASINISEFILVGAAGGIVLAAAAAAMYLSSKVKNMEV